MCFFVWQYTKLAEHKLLAKNYVFYFFHSDHFSTHVGLVNFTLSIK